MRVDVASLAKPGRAENEDLALVCGDLFAVLDGASVPKELSRCCARGARWYVERLSAGLVAELAGAPGRPLVAGLGRAIERVGREHQSDCSGAGIGPSAALTLARLRPDAVDYLVLGDCTIAALNEDEPDVVTDGRMSTVAQDVRARIYERLAEGGTYAHPDHRRDVVALVKAQLQARNTSTGYWIAADDPAAADEAVVGVWPARSSADLALLSDGAARAIDVFPVLASWRELMEALAAGETQTVLRQVRDSESADAAGQHFPRTSSSDDATLVAISS